MDKRITPDFIVDSRGGGVKPELAERVFNALDLRELFNTAGQKGNRDSQEFASALADLLALKTDQMQALVPQELHRNRGARLMIYDSVFNSKLEKFLAAEHVSLQIFEQAWRIAFGIDSSSEAKNKS